LGTPVYHHGERSAKFAANQSAGMRNQPVQSGVAEDARSIRNKFQPRHLIRSHGYLALKTFRGRNAEKEIIICSLGIQCVCATATDHFCLSPTACSTVADGVVADTSFWRI
jgi:hypothetical protein